MEKRGEPLEFDDGFVRDLTRSRNRVAWFGGRFIPGLRPRGHEHILGAGVEPSTAEASTVEASDDAVATEAVAVATEGLQRAGGPRGAVHGRWNEDSPAADLVPRGEDTGRRRPLYRALRDVKDFRPRNPPQAELRALLLRILIHLQRQPEGSREAARWWPVVRVYLRVLKSPEMASRKARRILDRLLALQADRLTERRLEFVLGRRRSRPRRRRSRKRSVPFVTAHRVITTSRGTVRRRVNRRQR